MLPQGAIIALTDTLDTIVAADLPPYAMLLNEGGIELYAFCTDAGDFIEALAFTNGKIDTQWGEEALDYLLEHTIAKENIPTLDPEGEIPVEEEYDTASQELNMLMDGVKKAQQEVREGKPEDEQRAQCKAEYIDWLQFRSLMPTVQGLRTRLNEIRMAEIDYLRRKDPGMNIQQVEMITAGIIEKIARQFVDHLAKNHQLSDKKVKAIKDIFQLDTDKE